MKKNSFTFFDTISNPRISIVKYNPKWTKMTPGDFPMIQIAHTRGPCAGTGINLSYKSFVEITKWFNKKSAPTQSQRMGSGPVMGR